MVSGADHAASGAGRPKPIPIEQGTSFRDHRGFRPNDFQKVRSLGQSNSWLWDYE